MTLTSDGLVHTVTGGLRVDTTLTKPVEEVGAKERNASKIKQTHTLDTVSNKLSSVFHTITNAASNSKTKTNGRNDIATSLQTLRDSKISRVGNGTGGRSDVGLTRDGRINGLCNTHLGGSSGSSTATKEGQQLIREVEKTTKVNVGDTGQTLLDVVVESQDSVTDTLLNSNTQSNLSDDVATGLDAAIPGLSDCATRSDGSSDRASGSGRSRCDGGYLRRLCR